MPITENLDDAILAARAFAFDSGEVTVAPLGGGLIHASYLASVQGRPHAVLQRINRRVFPEPARIIANQRKVLDHVNRKGQKAALRFPAIFTTRDGSDFHVDANGDCWRAQEFLVDTRSFMSIDRPDQARGLGRALAEFHNLLADLPPANLVSILRGFHETPRYLRQFDELCGRGRELCSELADCTGFINERRGLASVLQEARDRGALPLRVVHGDPKVDNFLFDRAGRQVVSLVDLDTVQAGLLHYDIGDCLRSCCNPAGEDPPQLADARFDTGLCRAWFAGYMEIMAPRLSAAETALIVPALRLLPLELGLRFLNDHMDGDRYFRVSERGQNLRRARVQFRLVEQIEAVAAELEALVAGHGNS